MPVSIQPATPDDVEVLTGLLLSDAAARQSADPVLWKIDADAAEKIETALRSAIEATAPPFRQQWLVAEADGAAVGVVHTILLPVPPIYAGEQGAPGLIMEDSHVAPDAPDGTAAALLAAAEEDLIGAGAEILLISSATGGAWEAVVADHAYDPLTLYLAKSGLARAESHASVRKARTDDLPGIVTLSAEHRQILFDLNTFWKPHAEADTRFGNWMGKSLTLTDRDMFVSGRGGGLTGYAISQPATPLHFPPAHDIGATGVIDDFYHVATRDPARDGPGLDEARALLGAAEGALADRQNDAVIVVCPAAWTSKRRLLEDAGYATAITWYIKR
ncbi:hypothetical protein [Chachezhania antarctica]|uniref:hypothetical protein n=1 Tax=Chachezhania antarctica TaxID=2340860 RepID=UPI000EAC00B8|nr:hypothetical protein [Chachezhania antarctica]